MDAIVGAQGWMHTVVEDWCIGCALCPPACPVDCIDMVAPRGLFTQALKRAAAARARQRKKRLSVPRVRQSSAEERKRILEQVLPPKRG